MENQSQELIEAYKLVIKDMKLTKESWIRKSYQTFITMATTRIWEIENWDDLVMVEINANKTESGCKCNCN